MKKFLMAIVIALIVSTPVVASDYSQECNIFGCITLYTGPRNAEAVDQYVLDGKAALQAVMDKNPSIGKADFRMRDGTLVLMVSNPATFKRSELFDAMREFKSRHVNIEQGIVITSTGRVIEYSDRRSGNYEGRSRYRALKDIQSKKFW